ncbi:MAG: hypothetical protein ACK59B_06020, partial [Alphaproteobacteria bacterium]
DGGRRDAARAAVSSENRRAHGAGESKNCTGIGSPYEPPENAEIHVNTVDLTPEQAADRIFARLGAAGLIG